MNFDEALFDIREELGLAPSARVAPTSDTLVGRWERFAQECERSFDGELDEYYSLLGVRSVLFRVMTHTKLMAYPDIADVAIEVARLDLRVRAVMNLDLKVSLSRFKIADGSAWYWHHFPSFGTKSLADEILANYGISIEVRPRISGSPKSSHT